MDYYLEAKFDARKSFYKKAQVKIDGDKKTLFSYGKQELKKGGLKT